jgi:hypothetical protein
MSRLQRFRSASNRSGSKTTAEFTSASGSKWRMMQLLGVSFSTLLFYYFMVLPSLGLTELNLTTKTNTLLMRHPTSGEQLVLEKEQLTINVNSTISSEIKLIVHDPNESKIEVHLLNDINSIEGERNERRCKFPIFKGRISGVSLSMIQWEKEVESSTTSMPNNNIENLSLSTMANNNNNKNMTTTTSNSDIIVGKYDRSLMPFSGRYYVEILILLCKETPNQFEDDGDGACLEDTENNKITSDDAYINIVKEEDTDDGVATATATTDVFSFVSPLGQWYHRDIVAVNAHDDHDDTANTSLEQQQLLPLNMTMTTTTVPIFTRYQPVKGCFMEKDKNSTRCRNAMDPNRLSAYQFQWKNVSHSVLDFDYINRQTSANENENANTGQSSSSTPKYNVCFLGASHSEWHIKNCNELVDAAAGYSNVTKSTEKKMVCSHLPFQYPHSVNPKGLDHLLRRNKIYRSNNYLCTHIVIGLFQWSFSFKNINHRPPLISKWKQDIKNVIQIIQNSTYLGIAIPKLFLRSVHLNPLKLDTSICYPRMRDWRTPINTKLCNKALQEISDENENVTFIDTDFIIGPMWDVSPDWNHLMGIESMEETKYILREVTGMNE